MSRTRRFAAGMLALAVLAMPATLAAQFRHPNGFVLTDGWNILFPLLNPFGAGPPVSVLNQNWIAPAEIGDPNFNPAPGTLQNIDFDLSPATGFNIGGAAPAPVWFDGPTVLGVLGGAFGYDKDGDAMADSALRPDQEDTLLNFQGLVDDWNNDGNQAVHGFEDIPGDNVLAVCFTYVNNTGPARVVNLCTGSDDSIQVWVNNRNVLTKSIPRGSGGAFACNETTSAWLPAGISKISALVWEGGGGHNLRLGLQEADGSVIGDDVEFLGPTGGTGQTQSTFLRTVDAPGLDADNCVTGSGGSVVIQQDTAAGDGGDMLSVTEVVRPFNSNGDDVSVADVTNGGVVSDILGGSAVPASGLTFSIDPSTDVCGDGSVNAQGFVEDTLMLGPIQNPGGAGPSNAFLQDIQIQSTTDASIDESDPNYRPGAGDTVPDNVLGIKPENCGNCDALNPGGVLTWNAVLDIPNFDFNPNYYGGDVNDAIVAVGFYVCTDVEKTVFFGVGSDDSFTVRVDGQVVGFRSIPRGCGGANSIQDFAGPVTLSPGKHFVMFKVYEGGGGHCGRVGIFEPAPVAKQIDWTVARSVLEGDGVSYSFTGARPSMSGSVSEPAEGAPVPLSGASGASVDNITGAIGIFDGGQRVGNATVATASFDDGSGAYTVTANGEDVWNGGDHMMFLYKKTQGDFIATAHVAERIDPAGGSRWGKHGIMARYTCDFNSKHSSVETNLATDQGEGGQREPIDLARHHLRGNHLENGSNSEPFQLNDGWIPGTDPLLGFGIPDDRINRRPQWLRLVRRGDYIYTYLSFEDEAGAPLQWSLLGWDRDGGRPEELLVGIYLTAHSGGNAGPTGTIVVDQVTIEPIANLSATAGGADIFAESFDVDGVPPADAVVQRGDFAPVVENGALVLNQDGIGGQANAVWFLDTGANGDEGFIAEFDVEMQKGDGGCDPALDPNPADGMTFAVFETAGKADLFMPFPEGIDLANRVGGGGGAEAYNDLIGNGEIEGHASFAVEMDNWVGGSDPGDAGSPNFDCSWHTGVLSMYRVDPHVKTNVENDVATADLPNIFAPGGVHFTIVYQRNGAVDVVVQGNQEGSEPVHAVSSAVTGLAGDLVVGFTGATGGATARVLIDNLRLSTVCSELSDSVSIAGAPEGEVNAGDSVTLEATVDGVDDGGAASYSWSVAGPGEIVGAADQSTVEVACTDEGTVTVSVSAGDGVCEDTADAMIDITCVPGGVLKVPGDANNDSNMDLSDLVFLANFLFVDASLVLPCPGDHTVGGNVPLLDFNGDGGVDLSDVVANALWQFSGGPSHPLNLAAAGPGCTLIDECEGGDDRCEP